MRALVILAVIALTACGPPTTAQPSLVRASPSPTGCSLPVWWAGEGSDVHAGFVSVPDGAFKDAGVLPGASGGGYGATYDRATGTWIRASRPMVSLDGSRYTYWTADPSREDIHVVDVATGADHVAYSGAIAYIVIGFESDAIYVTHIINVRQGAFERLYRLDPSGGTPQLVPGSDRHMYQWGWVLIADGAAWGIDSRPAANDYIYSVLRLDLGTAQVTEWIEGPTMLWPQGVDGSHRLFAAAFSGPLWRVDAPGHAVQLESPSQVFFSGYPGAPSSFAAAPRGVWFSGKGAVWLSSDAQPSKLFTVGPATEDVYPAGTCLS